MKTVKANVFRDVHVILNTSRADRPQWARIVVDGKVAHTGQRSYIRRIAKKRYTLLPTM